MYVLDAGARVTQVRFLPDGRLLVGTWAAGDAELVILALPAGPRVVIPLPARQVWDQPNQVAVSPAGDRLYTTFGALRTLDPADGYEPPGGPSGPASQVVVSPDGRRLVVAHAASGGETVLVGLTAAGQRVWEQRFPHPERQFLAGFADADRFLVVGGYASARVTAHSFATGNPGECVRHPTRSISRPQLSSDGRHLGVIAHGSLYVYATTLGKPRQIKAGQTFGNFVGFAFHPAGRTLAVIHGGPTLVKLYDLHTLTLRARLNWKVGPLTCVAYSPDGQLAAAGTDDGRVVVWDADE